MDEEERIKQFCRAYASAMLHPDAAKAMPAIGSMLAQQARQELQKGCELFPETVEAKVRKLYEHADAIRKGRRSDIAEPKLLDNVRQ